MMYSFGLPLYARLSEVICASQWQWPPIRSTAMAEIMHLTDSITLTGSQDIAQ